MKISKIILFICVFCNISEARLFESKYILKQSDNSYHVKMSTYSSGKFTASGIRYNNNHNTIAYHHLKEIPLWSIVKITLFPVLKLNSEEKSVKFLQIYLNNNGFECEVTGIFDKQTQKAVKDAQKKYKLKQSGVADYNLFEKFGIDFCNVMAYFSKYTYAVVTDHGPFIRTDPKRLADASTETMKKLIGYADGVHWVKIEIIGKSEKQEAMPYIINNTVAQLAQKYLENRLVKGNQ